VTSWTAIRQRFVVIERRGGRGNEKAPPLDTSMLPSKRGTPNGRGKGIIIVMGKWCKRKRPREGGRANYIVQRSGGDGIKLALALLWERREEMAGAFPVLIVHDEIVVECGVKQAEAATVWLKRAMLDALAPLLDPVPVEAVVGVDELGLPTILTAR
jgi:hypothetical protein